jgi:hypothetical protein
MGVLILWLWVGAVLLIWIWLAVRVWRRRRSADRVTAEGITGPPIDVDETRRKQLRSIAAADYARFSRASRQRGGRR